MTIKPTLKVRDEKSYLESIDKKLTTIINLVASIGIKGLGKKEQIKALSSAGMNSTEIGERLAISPETVRSHIHQMKTRPKVRKKIIKTDS